MTEIQQIGMDADAIDDMLAMHAQSQYLQQSDEQFGEDMWHGRGDNFKFSC